MTVCVAVPVYRRSLSQDEQLALRHLDHYLPGTEKVLVMPQGLDFARDGYDEARFDPSFFRGIAGYNRLMLSRQFYEHFERYDYILIHQLDALVLRSDLDRFTSLDLDYLGAPWADHGADDKPFLTHVGNGGLSLRRVKGLLRLLDSPARKMGGREFYRRGYADGPRRLRPAGVYRALLRSLGPYPTWGGVARRLTGDTRVDFAAEAKYYRGGGEAEDRYLSAEAKNYCPSLVFGTIEQALEFAFEREPRFCYVQAGERMPFGAHAWARHDRRFWEPHLLA